MNPWTKKNKLLFALLTIFSLLSWYLPFCCNITIGGGDQGHCCLAYLLFSWYAVGIGFMIPILIYEKRMKNKK